MARILIGTSGWSYQGWRGPFYPDDLPRSRELEFAVRSFDSIELNGTFYRLTSATACRRWRAVAPEGFVYSVKGSRFVTHNKKLDDLGTALANFFAAGVLELGDTLGPFLWQVSAKLQRDPDRLDRFLGTLPPDTTAAARLAKDHDQRVRDPGFGDEETRELRHVVELRHRSWFVPETMQLLRDHRVALAFSHSSVWPYAEDITSDFVYLRLHGPNQLYDSPYGDQLVQWATRVQRWAEGSEPAAAHLVADIDPGLSGPRDVYVYFDNDGHAFAPREARELRRMLDEGTV